MTRAASFAPLVDAATQVLIVGSLPGRASLVQQQYYAHPRNQFWDLVGAVLGIDLVALAYPERVETLARGRVGVWDVIASAARAGSLDSAIRDHQPNDLAALADRLPTLRGIGFNGATAYRLGAAALRARGVPLIALPSSSPAYAALPLSAKRAAWLRLRACLDPA